MKVTTAVLVIGVALGSFSQGAAAQPFSQVIVFGDSNVDSGYYKALANPGGGTTYNSLWASAVAHGAGAPTTSPGLMNSQFLAAFFNLTANPANTAGGTNYATSGAKNEISNSAANGGFTAAIPTGTQIRNYVNNNGGVADSQALYLIWSGDNDVSYANGDTGSSPPPNPNSYVMEAAEDLNGDILILRNAGAQHIIVSGLAYNYPTGNSTDAVNKRALKLLYTQTLFQNLTQLGVTYYQADINKVRLAISANPSNYGFANIGTGAGQMGCTQPSGVSTAWALLCSSDASAPSTLVSPTSPSTDLFADDQHLGTAGQKLMANFLFRQVVPATITHNFNVDRASDILWRDNSGNVAIWEMNGTAVLNQATSFVANVPGGSWAIAGTGDFNGDGKSDILWHDTSGNVAIWEMNGTTILNQATSFVANVGGTWSIVGIGDFNGDGMSDILWHDTSGNVAIWEMNGTTILNQATSFVANVPGGNWSIVGTGDFNNDGMSDILWHDISGNVAIWEMNGTKVSNASTSFVANVTGTWSIAGTGDFNGDGLTDLLWHDTSGNVAIWEMNGTTILNQATSFVANVPGTWSILGSGDYNGAGKSDIVWHDSSGNVAIWEMNGTTILNQATSFVANVATNWSIINPQGQ
jgi:phospholipase/lecithinase/hemolysin